ncbi:hypothetical protein V8C35DRAFT_280368 [Trichoderma chlorosporum]
MRFQLLFTIAALFSTTALGTDEKKGTKAVRRAVQEIKNVMNSLYLDIAPPQVHDPDGGPSTRPDPGHAWLEEKAKSGFPKIHDSYHKYEPILADNAKNWDINVDPENEGNFCGVVARLFTEHGNVIKTLDKYYKDFSYQIAKEITPEVVPFQEQCKVRNDRLKIIDELLGPEDCAKAHESFESAASAVENLIRLNGTTAEL